MSRVLAALWQRGLDPITSSVTWIDGRALGHTRLKKFKRYQSRGCNFQSKKGTASEIQIMHTRKYIFFFIFKSLRPLRRQGKTKKGGFFLPHSGTKGVELLPWWALSNSHNLWEICVGIFKTNGNNWSERNDMSVFTTAPSLIVQRTHSPTWGRVQNVGSQANSDLMLWYSMLWYGMVDHPDYHGMVRYGMVGHADPPTPQIWAPNMCHIHGGPVYTTQPTREWRRGAFSKRNLKVVELICVILHVWWDQLTYTSQIRLGIF